MMKSTVLNILKKDIGKTPGMCVWWCVGDQNYCPSVFVAIFELFFNSR